MSRDSRGGFTVGDVLRVSCPPARARVVHVTALYITVEWPWARIDPDSEIHWDGRRAIPTATDNNEWGGLFQIDQHDGLAIGDSCLVSIPETIVRIIDLGHCDPPADVGWLPRPHTMLIVLPVGHSGGEEEGDTIEIESAPPIKIERA